MLLLADVPGTEQIPDFVSDAACQQAASGSSVFVGLEIPEQEQSRLDEFLHSAGTEADRARLLDGDFWRRPQQDGRSSRAVLQLLDDVRQMINKRYRVSAFAFEASRAQGPDRDAAMAENILAWRERAPDALFIVVAISDRIRNAGAATGAVLDSMTAHLRRKERWLTLLTAAFDGGMAWTCEGPGVPNIRCGPHAIRSRRPGPYPFSPAGPGSANRRFVVKWPRMSPDGYQGTYYVGQATASPPALELRQQTSAEVAARTVR